MITDSLYNNILMQPAKEGADQLCIVSGYATPSMASTQLKYFADEKVPFKLDLIVGMPSLAGMQLYHHLGFKKLMQEDYPDNFQCSYIHTPPAVHSKVYVWIKDKKPFRAFNGSANFTHAAFWRLRESIAECDPELGFAYYNKLATEAAYCTYEGIDDLIIFIDNDPTLKSKPATKSDGEIASGNLDLSEDNTGIGKITISFLANKGYLPQGSGLNWGKRKKIKREPNQAYIRVPVSVDPDNFFPPIAEHFTVFTDDNKTMILARAQQKGKALHTPNNNSEIGIYFRQRLGVPLGDPVLKEHLDRYGRHDVTFYKIDEETYFMDFASPLN